MKLLQYYPIILLKVVTGTLLFLLYSCQKEEETLTKAPPSTTCIESSAEKNFLDYHYASKQNTKMKSGYYAKGKDSLTILRVIEAARKINCQNRTAVTGISNFGYQLWDKSNVAETNNMDGSRSPIIISPMAFLDGDTTTAILFCILKNEFEFYLWEKKKIMEAYDAGNYNRADYISSMTEFKRFDETLFGKTWEIDSLAPSGDLIESRCVVTVTECRDIALKPGEDEISSRGSCYTASGYIGYEVTVTYNLCGSGSSGGGGSCIWNCGSGTTGGSGNTSNGGGGGGSGGNTNDCLQYIRCFWGGYELAKEQLTLFPPTYCFFTGEVYSIGNSCSFVAKIYAPKGRCAEWILESDNSYASYTGARNIDVYFSGTYVKTKTTGVSGVLTTESIVGTRTRIEQRDLIVMNSCHDCLSSCDEP